MNTFSEVALSERNFYFIKHEFGERIMNPSNLFKILYVETNEDDGFLLETAIDCPSVEITLAKTIKEALRLSQIENFNLVLLETRFPDGCGFELCRKILLSKPHTPVIFYSGDAAEKDKKLGLELGAKDYLTKPHFDSLTMAVSEYIGLNA
jgi:DNA-binding response OmpR family regulator